MNFLSDFALHQVKWINFEVDQTHSPWGVQLPYRDYLLCMPIIWQPLPETASTNTVRLELCDSRYGEATGADRLSHKPSHLHQPQSPWVSDHSGGVHANFLSNLMTDFDFDEIHIQGEEIWVGWCWISQTGSQREQRPRFSKYVLSFPLRFVHKKYINKQKTSIHKS